MMKRFRQRLARVGILVAAGSLGVVALLPGQAIAGVPTAHAADLNALFHAFVKLDRKLTRAIDEANKGRSVELLIKKIRDGKFAIVDAEMTAPIDGVKGSEWFSDLDCVDRELTLAEQDEHGHVFHHAEIFLDHAKRCKQTLENDLHKAGKSPDSLFGAFVKLDRKLTRAIDEANKGRSVELLIKKIRDGKFAIVDAEMTAPIDGVKGSEWFSDLDCVDRELTLAEQDEHGHVFHHAEIFLDHAKRCKQALENDLHKANAQPRCTGHAMLGNIYGGQAHQLVSDFTCPKASTEFSLTVPSGYQITGGEASNTASSGGYSCNLNTTNTTVDCTGNAPAASTTYVQMTTSPNPQAGMLLPLKVSFSDRSATSFTLTSE